MINTNNSTTSVETNLNDLLDHLIDVAQFANTPLLVAVVNAHGQIIVVDNLPPSTPAEMYAALHRLQEAA